jgi:hypothetical protein
MRSSSEETICLESRAIAIKTSYEHKSVENLQDVTLIDEDGGYFFIQKQADKETKTIRIKKSFVNAIIHQKKQGP